MTQRVEWHEDKIIRKSILGKKETPYKQIAAYYINESTNNNVSTKDGYFRGIIIRKKDGSRFALYKEELTNFEQLQPLLKTRSKQLQKKAVGKILRKENQKIFVIIVLLIGFLIWSLMH